MVQTSVPVSEMYDDPGVIKNAVSPLSAIHFRFKIASKSPLMKGFSIDLVYAAQSGSPQGSDVSQLAGFVASSFSSTPTGGTNSPSKYFPSLVPTTTNAHLWEAYDISQHLDGTPAGSPVVVGSYTITGQLLAGTVPEGCAIAITLQAGYGTDVEFTPGHRPRASDRGRIYFGPLCASSCLQTDTNGHTQLTTNAMTDLCLWIKAINSYTSAADSINWQLGVWSRAQARIKSLVQVSIDDRCDYQRRRAGVEGSKHIQTLP